MSLWTFCKGCSEKNAALQVSYCLLLIYLFFGGCYFYKKPSLYRISKFVDCFNGSAKVTAANLTYIGKPLLNQVTLEK